MRAVVTGGAGFIGSHLSLSLAKEHEVIVIDDLSAGRMENLSGASVKLHIGSVLDPDLLSRAFAGADMVFHLAAVASVTQSIADPVGTSWVNAMGTLNVLEAARAAGAKRVIFSSSTAVYGNGIDQLKSEDMQPEPMSPYAVSKLAGEGYVLAYNRLYGMENSALRYFNVYGPGQDPSSEYAAVVPKFITAALRNRTPVIYGDGEQTRDFVYVEDVVAANLLAARWKAPGLYNVASGISTSINELLRIVENVTGRALSPLRQPARPGDVRHSAANISKILRMGWEPEVSLERGLQKTAEQLAQDYTNS
ncbi:MAG: UDP-galactose-4-epimerase [Methanosaeta sp. PtaB.Bin039]|nr:MAG: UDP-galactose-4-epimerase [Methanosaeta sp. PtaB.Bin039]OPY46626.1 MAG: UDP-galactose-4-epimerase [Methanosaeta sp. PtaU1.Bin028]HOT05997.1 NAD-dependent epimerase/dehydratase family protein [Methanotrichaceae archaeon]HQF16799.1 NAD-dependent epimerase/dehydratase family protein [Methanotrichaceae archaeon]HQI90125.1 NAD-dependent epimerase/dehydratase family protein [Methanotrichaceae archaeon]